MALLHHAFLVASTVMYSIQAERMEGSDLVGEWAEAELSDPTREKLKAMLEVENRFICGDDRIKNILAGATDVTSIRNIAWSEIVGEDGICDDFIKHSTAEIAKLKTEIVHLGEEILAKMQAEEPNPISDEKLEEVIKAAFTAAGDKGFDQDPSSNPLERAKKTRCGLNRIRPRVARGANKAVTDSFKIEAAKVFTGKIRVTHEAVLAKMNALLPGGDSEGSTSDNSWCDELNEQIADAAVALSDATAGVLVGSSSEELKKQASDMASLLDKTQADLEHCQTAKQELTIFSGQITQLKKEIEVSHDAWVNAREDIRDEEDVLDDLLENEKQAKETVAKMLALLTAASEKVKAARAALADIQKRETKTRLELEAAEQALAEARAELKAARDADVAVKDLKAAVVDTMVKMLLFFDEAVRQPIRDIGLGDDTEVNEYFHEGDAADLGSSEALKSSLSSLQTFCADHRNIFKTVKSQHKLNVGALCNLGGSSDALSKDIAEAVTSRVSSVKQSLRDVQSWLDPFKGVEGSDREAKMKKVEDAVSKGEPQGLREVIGIFSQTVFAKYLQKWELGGVFLTTYEKLGKIIETLKQKADAAQTKVDQVNATLQEVITKRKAAEVTLQEAIDAEAIAKANHDKAVALLEEIKQQIKTQEELIVQLEEKAKAAEASVEEAKRVLSTAHSEASGLLQMFEELNIICGANREKEDSMIIGENHLINAKTHAHRRTSIA